MNNTNEKGAVWSEIRIDYFDDTDQCYCVDAWKTDSDDEEGLVIAKIYPPTMYVEYLDESAKDSEQVRNAIKEALPKLSRQLHKLPDDIEENIMNIIKNNEANRRMAAEVINYFEKIDCAPPYAYDGDDVDVRMIDNRNIITPAISEDGKTLTDNHISATESKPGIYARVVKGCTEDSSHSTLYLPLGGGKYVKLMYTE